jgi:hypothetical protein
MGLLLGCQFQLSAVAEADEIRLCFYSLSSAARGGHGFARQPLRSGLAVSLHKAGYLCTEAIFKRATHPPPADAGGWVGGTTLHWFHRWQICRSLSVRYRPSSDVYSPSGLV